VVSDRFDRALQEEGLSKWKEGAFGISKQEKSQDVFINFEKTTEGSEGNRPRRGRRKPPFRAELRRQLVDQRTDTAEFQKHGGT